MASHSYIGKRPAIIGASVAGLMLFGVSAAVLASGGAHAAWAGFAELVAKVRQSGPVTNNRGYRDDTFAVPGGARVQTLSGDIGLKRYNLPPKQGSGRLFLDLRAARFTVSNSRNSDPSPERPCDKGALPVNNRPLNIFTAEDVTIVGGTIFGTVPQNSDWKSTYCNSAAVNFWDSPNGVVDGIRISKAWDGVRFGRKSGNFLIRNMWLSEVRDDAIENDYLHSGRIEDSLIDGTLQGLSLRPNASSSIGPTDGLVEISGSLIRLREYRSKGRASLGSLVKNDPRAPKIELVNSVIALDSHETMEWSNSWALTWSKLAGGPNNLMLWLSDRPIPPGWNVPSRFQLLTGRQARTAWAAAKRNWIDCHPKVARLPGDPASDFKRCRPGTWGGYSK